MTDVAALVPALGASLYSGGTDSVRGTGIVTLLPDGGVRGVLQTQTEIAAFAGLAFLVGAVVMWLGTKRFRTGRLIQNTPPENVRAVAVGRTELHGTARDAGVTFDQPFTEGECLFYSYEIEQYEKKRTTDSDGNTETERTWNTTSSHSIAAPFYLEDDTGEMLVVANAGADFEVSDENEFSETFSGRSIPDEYKKSIRTDDDIAKAIPANVDWEPHNLSTRIESKIPFFSIPGTSNDVKPRDSGTAQQPDFSTEPVNRGQVLKRRISQRVLPVDDEVYVFGAATVRENAAGSNEDRLVIQGDDGTGRFIISDKDERALAKTYTRWGLAFIGLGLVAMTFGVWYFAGNILA
jgi:DNA/RNA endonuclease YhcR with UshA esterase domain